MAGGRAEPEAHVGHAQGGVHPRQLFLDATDGLDGGHGIAAQVVVAGGQREGEGVEDEVAGSQSVALDGQIVDAAGHPHLPLHVTGLTLFVDQQADHRCAVLRCQLHHAIEARPLGLTVFEVGRVQDGPTAHPLQTGFHHLGFGGVQHQRGAHLGGQTLGKFVHVVGTVTAHVVGAHVEHMGAFTHLVPGHLQRGVPVGVEHGLTELLGPVGVGALPDDEKRRILMERHERVDGRGAVFVHRGTWRRGEVGASLHHRSQMRRGGAATPTHHGHTEVGDEVGVVLGELSGGEVVVHVPVDHRRQPGVGDARDGHAGMLRQVSHVLVHLHWPGGAVDADDVGAHGVERRQCRPDLGTRQHPTGEFHGDLHLHGHGAPARRHGPSGADHGGLGSQQVELRFDDEQVHAAVDEPTALFGVMVTQFGEADLAQAGKAGAGSNRARHPAGAVGGGVVGGNLFGQAGSGHVEFVGPLGDVVLGQRDGKRAEAVGLDHIHAHLEVLGVQLADELGPGDGEQFVASLEVVATEIVGGEAEFLDAGAHGAVEDHDALTCGSKEVVGCRRHFERLPVACR